MIIPIILLILTILVFSFLIVFTYLVLFPSLKNNTKQEMSDTVISYEERNYIVPEKKDFNISDKKALVLCSCHKTFKNPQNSFNEGYTCYMIKSNQDSGADCKFACIGLGDCVKVCSQEAISIVNNTAVISELCCGCGKCIDICPQKIIQMVPKNTKKYVSCSNHNINELTSCSELRKENNINWEPKKDFKIWSYCYKISKSLKKIISGINKK